MDLFSIDLTQTELQVLRQSLEIITITGKDAKFIASLQMKLESELQQIAEMLLAAERQKQQELQDLLKAEESKKTSNKSSK